MKTKKIIASGLVLCFAIMFVFVSTVNAGMTNVWTHRYDSSGGGPLHEIYGLSSMNGAGDEILSSSGAAAFATLPIGRETFKMSFYVVWSPENIDEGMSGYLDNFLTLWFSDSPAYPVDPTIPFVHDTGVVPVQFRLTNRHTQAVNDAALDIIKEGIADFGGKTLSSINDQCVSKFYIELSDTVDETKMLRLWMDDGGTERGVCYFDIAEDIFNSTTDHYFNVGQFGSPYFTVYNAKVEESDIEGSEGKMLDNWLHLAGTDTPFREVTGLTSTEYTGTNMVSWGTAAAFSALPLGETSFTASFDLVWYDSNLDDGASGYLDNFLGLYIADETTFPSVANDQPYVTGIPETFRLANRHAQAVIAGGSTATPSAGIVDFGGANLFLGVMNLRTFVLELEGNVLSLHMRDGDTARGSISITYPAGSFAAGTQQYLCFAQYNNPKFMVRNLVVEDSDVASCVTDFAVNYYEAPAPTETPEATATPTTAISSPETGSGTLNTQFAMFMFAGLIVLAAVLVKSRLKKEY